MSDLGIAFTGLVDGAVTSDRRPTLFPAIGMRKSGDKVTLAGKWISYKGCTPDHRITDLAEVTNMLRFFDDSQSRSAASASSSATLSSLLPETRQFMRESWKEWRKWKSERFSQYPVRASIADVEFDTSPTACALACRAAPEDLSKGASDSSATSKMKWGCTLCTFLNSSFATACEACGSPQTDDCKWEKPEETEAPVVESKVEDGTLVENKNEEVDTEYAACLAAGADGCGNGIVLFAGDRVRILAMQSGQPLDVPEEAVVLGAYAGRLWYHVIASSTGGHDGSQTEGAAHAWFWLPNEIANLEVIERAEYNANRDSGDEDMNEHGLDWFMAEIFGSGARSWSRKIDEQIVLCCNSCCAQHGVNAESISPRQFLIPPKPRGYALKDPFFAIREIPLNILGARLSVLRLFNRKCARALPLVCLHFSTGSALGLRPSMKGVIGKKVGGQTYPEPRFNEHTLGAMLQSARNLLFTSTKLSFWQQIIRGTTEETPPSNDEYEDPREIRTVRVNRVQATLPKLAEISPQIRMNKSVFGQLYSEFSKWPSATFRRSYVGKGHGGQARAFKVKFLGEGVNDYGGPYRAIFEAIVDELQSDTEASKRGDNRQCLLPLLIPSPNRYDSLGDDGRDKFLFNPQAFSPLQVDAKKDRGTSSTQKSSNDISKFQKDYAHGVAMAYEFWGKLVGCAIRHGMQLALDLPGIVWKPLVGQPLTIEQLGEVDVMMRNQLKSVEAAVKALKTMDSRSNSSDENPFAEVLGMDLFFSVTGSDGLAHDLVPGGADIPVTLDNCEEYLRLAAKYRLLECTEQLRLFWKGLHAVLPVELFPLFSAEELEALLCGNRAVDVDLLQSCAEYEGVTPDDKHVQYLWETLREITDEERTSFLRFVWARSRMPHSAQDLPMNFRIQADHGKGDQHLPHAQTCFFSLSLPAYSSKEILKEKLLYAMSETGNIMDADVRLRSAEGWGTM